MKATRYNYKHDQLNTIDISISFLRILLRGGGAQNLTLPPGRQLPSLRHCWRKVVKRIWKIPSTTHCSLLPSTNKSLPIEFLMKKGVLNLFGHVLIVIT